MRKRQIEYSEYVRFLYADPTRREEDDILHLARDITFQITSSCNLRCSYCYEHHKCSEDMNIETAKRIIDSVFDTYEADNDTFINRDTKAIVLDFIGGEPLLKAKLIEEICDYWFAEGIRREIPIIPFTRISFATNGMLWFSEESQHLIKKYHEYMSLSVSIDGIKELHDMHRVDKNGNGSFDTAFRAFQDGKQYNWYNSKMTFVPESFQYICDSVKMMIDEGCVDIFCNYAYEPVYTKEQAKALFTELRKLADYLVTEKKDVFVSILDDEIGEQYKDDKNYCGGTGDMLSYAPDGKAYPCVRYAPISVGKEKAEKMVLGDCFNGLYQTDEQKRIRDMLNAITMKSQSEQKCIECPVSVGCGWCSGYNYEITGTPNKRLTNVCLVHKARVLAACYYVNKRYIEIGDCDPKKINLPYEEAVDLIGEDAALDVFTYEYIAALFYEKNLEK